MVSPLARGDLTDHEWERVLHALPRDADQAGDLPWPDGDGSQAADRGKERTMIPVLFVRPRTNPRGGAERRAAGVPAD
jgi:hypothetical protein